MTKIIKGYYKDGVYHQYGKLYGGIGINTDGAMTQKAVTESVLPIENGQYSMPCAVPKKMINSSGVLAGNSQTYGTTDFMMLEDGQTKLKVISGVWHANTSYCQVFFYTAADESTGISGERDTKSSTAREITNHTYDVPSNAKYFRFTVKQNAPAVIEIKGSIVNAIAEAQEDLNNMQDDVATLQTGLAQNDLTTQRCAESLNINALLVASAHNGSALSKTGGLLTNVYTTSKGVSDFIPVTVGEVWLLESNFYMGSSGYAYACFYTAADESAFLSYKAQPTQGEVTNTEITVPEDAAYMRLCLNNKDLGGVISKGDPVNVQAIKEQVEGIAASKFEVRGQIYNFPLPYKSTSDELNILYIGSSYGVDTITALADIANNVGVKVNTADFFVSGATISGYLTRITNKTDTTIYRNYVSDGVVSRVGGAAKIHTVLAEKAWDVVVLEDEDVRKPTFTPTKKAELVELVTWIKRNCTNPRCVIALNSTWTWSEYMANQNDSFKVVVKDSYYTGIDVVIPSGAAIALLRDTAVNDGHDIYRDSIHLNTGVGRFTAACAAYYALVYPVLGVSLTNCDITGKWIDQGSVDEEYEAIEVAASNRDTCIDCAWKANGNRFLL